MLRGFSGEKLYDTLFKRQLKGLNQVLFHVLAILGLQLPILFIIDQCVGYVLD